MNGELTTSELGAVVAGIAAAVAITVRLLGPAVIGRPALLFAVGGWVMGVACIAPDQLQERPLLLAAGAVLAVVLGTLLARALADRFGWLLLVGGAVLPLRVPVLLGGETYNLLLPLYAVIGLAALSVAWSGAAAVRRHPLLDAGVSLTVLVGAASLLWSRDLPAGAVDVLLFLVPFALLYVTLRASDLAHARNAGRAFIAVMSLAAIAGLYQRATHTIWQNPKLQVANQYTPDFRTNSIFWDPNIYGRYLVLALVLLLAGMLLEHSRNRQSAHAAARAAGAGIGILLLAGLWHTWSQSSWVALSVACLVLALLVMRRRERLVAGVLIALALAALPALASRAGDFGEQGRVTIATRGLDLARSNPWAGLGTGSFETAYLTLAKQRDGRVGQLRASHTTPVTVAAEWGIVGLVAYLTLIIGAMTAAVGVARLRERERAASWALAGFAALIAHSMFYAGFFEDPITWVALALLASLPAPATNKAGATSVAPA